MDTPRSFAVAIVAVIFFVIGLPASAGAATEQESFDEAQRAYRQNDYQRALANLEAFLKTAKPSDPRRFGAIEQVARIHLQYKRDADAAIAFLNKVKTNSKLTGEHRDHVLEWLATAHEWKKMGALDVRESADKLFKLGKQYYDKGIANAGDLDDETGAAARYISASYLVPFVINFDTDPRLADALLMLGDIRRRSWQTDDFWTVDFYLKEAIRRFPGTKQAQRAFNMLDEDIRLRWSGSGGDRTPEYLLNMLARHRKLAFGSAPQVRSP